MIEENHPRLSITRQCELVSIARSSFYYRGKGESALNLLLMRKIDEEFLRHPCQVSPHSSPVISPIGPHPISPDRSSLT